MSRYTRIIADESAITARPAGRTWLMLVHQLPATPAYLRVKLARRLRRLGAVALKSSVYLLPDTATTREDFAWLQREIVAEGGEATVITASWLAGTSDSEVEDAFRRERARDYEEIAAEAATAPADTPREALQRLRRRLAEVAERDFFPGGGTDDAFAAIEALATRIAPPPPQAQGGPTAVTPLNGTTWVTRRDVGIDRLACAWLIRRRVDPAARFRFVDPDRYQHSDGEIRFDMFAGEVGHEGDRCSFETLLARYGLEEPALRRLGEVVHDVDCKDERYGHPEVSALAAMVAGIAAANDDDSVRVAIAEPLFDALHAAFGGAVAAPAASSTAGGRRGAGRSRDSAVSGVSVVSRKGESAVVAQTGGQ